MNELVYIFGINNGIVVASAAIMFFNALKETNKIQRLGEIAFIASCLCITLFQFFVLKTTFESDVEKSDRAYSLSY